MEVAHLFVFAEAGDGPAGRFSVSTGLEVQEPIVNKESSRVARRHSLQKSCSE